MWTVFTAKLGEYENLDELNYLASKLDEMSESEYAQFQAGMEMGDHCGSLQEIINLTENLDCYEGYPDIHDYDDLAAITSKNWTLCRYQSICRITSTMSYGRDVALEETAPSRIRVMCVIRVTVSMSITTVSAAVSPTSTG